MGKSATDCVATEAAANPACKGGEEGVEERNSVGSTYI